MAHKDKDTQKKAKAKTTAKDDLNSVEGKPRLTSGDRGQWLSPL
jgi:hypothetical protein